MMGHAARCLLLGVAVAAASDLLAQDARVVVRDPGTGIAGRLLQDALSKPYRVIVAPDSGIVLGRATDVDRTLLVIGGPARLEGHVSGDFIVLGDLVLR